MSQISSKEIELSKGFEKLFFWLAVVLSISSVGIAGRVGYGAHVSGEILAFRDFSIFIVLLILSLFFFLRYRQVLKDYAVRESLYHNQTKLIHNLITEQVGFYQQVMRQTRASFYNEFGAEIYPHRFQYRNEALRDIMEKSLTAVVSVTLSILKNQFEMHDIRGKVSVSVKAIVTGKMAKEICKLGVTAEAAINERKEYIITLARDAETRALQPEREVREAVYSLNDNSDFSTILSGTASIFCTTTSKRWPTRIYTATTTRTGSATTMRPSSLPYPTARRQVKGQTSMDF